MFQLSRKCWVCNGGYFADIDVHSRFSEDVKRRIATKH